MNRILLGLGLASCLTVSLLGCQSARDRYGDDGRAGVVSGADDRNAIDRGAAKVDRGIDRSKGWLWSMMHPNESRGAEPYGK